MIFGGLRETVGNLLLSQGKGIRLSNRVETKRIWNRTTTKEAREPTDNLGIIGNAWGESREASISLAQKQTKVL